MPFNVPESALAHQPEWIDFINAIKQNNLIILNILLTTGAAAHITALGNAALRRAVAKGHIAIINRLLEFSEVFSYAEIHMDLFANYRLQLQLHLYLLHLYLQLILLT
jgi:hypothetical protein